MVVKLAYRREVLDNGLVCLVSRNPSAPSAAIEIHTDGGPLRDARGLEGTAELAGRCLTEGAAGRSVGAIAARIEDVGGELRTGSNGLSMTLLAEHVPQAMGLAADLLRRPAFPTAGVRLRRELLLDGLRADLELPEVRARQALRRLIYGHHPMARPGGGQPKTVGRLRRGHLADFHARWCRPDRVVVSVAGDVGLAATLAAVQGRFGSWNGVRREVPALPEVPDRARPAERSIKGRPEQAVLLMGHLGVKRDDTDFPALLVLDRILGHAAGLSDRLNARLREKEGLAYSVYASITAGAGMLPGLFTVEVATSNDRVRRAELCIREELDRLRSRAAPAAEVARARAVVAGGLLMHAETNAARCRLLIDMERFGWAPADLLEQVHGVGPSDVRRAARRHLRPDDLCRVVAS